MLVIKVEMWPFGQEDKAVELHRAFLWNDGTGTRESGNYIAEFNKKNQKEKGKGVWKKSQIKGFPRTKLLAWDLVAQMLVMALGPDRIAKAWGKK